MPVDWSNYPANWNEISRQVKEYSGYKCERCGKQCRRPNEPHVIHKNTLTVAHLNHTPMDCADDNLIALCAPCHLKYDAPYKVLKNIVKNRKCAEYINHS